MAYQTSFLSRTWNSNSAVTRLVMVCIGVFIIQLIFKVIPGASLFTDKLMLTPNMPDLMIQPWSLFTYIFMHSSIMHLLGNMLWLYFIGMLLEDLLGSKHIWKLFIWGGIAGGLLYILTFNLAFQHLQGHYMVGASAGVVAIIVGTALYLPNYEILFFGVFPIKLKYIAGLRVLLDLSGLGDGINDGGQIAHLGGAIFGLFYIWHIRGSLNFDFLNKWFVKKPVEPKRNVRYKVEVNVDKKNRSTAKSKVVEHSKPDQEEIDAILDKINAYGYDSLSSEEKRTLFKASD